MSADNKKLGYLYRRAVNFIEDNNLKEVQFPNRYEKEKTEEGRPLSYDDLVFTNIVEIDFYPPKDSSNCCIIIEENKKCIINNNRKALYSISDIVGQENSSKLEKEKQYEDYEISIFAGGTVESSDLAIGGVIFSRKVRIDFSSKLQARLSNPGTTSSVFVVLLNNREAGTISFPKDSSYGFFNMILPVEIEEGDLLEIKSMVISDAKDFFFSINAMAERETWSGI